MVCRRYKLRPSDVVAGDIDHYGFDLAVAITAMEAKRAAQPAAGSGQGSGSGGKVEVNPDPVAFFNKWGKDGWNAGKN